NFRLIEPYDASDDSVSKTQRVAIAHSGRMHYELAVTDPIFVGDMAFATPVRSTKLVDSLRSLRARRMGGEEWHKVQHEFIEYCLEQDQMYMHVPTDPIYEGQRQLRYDMKARWVDRKDVNFTGAEKPSQGFSHHPAVVKWYSVDRGYGFANANVGQDVF